MAHRGAKGDGDLLNDEDGGHPLTSLQQADGVAVQASVGREGFLGQPPGFPPPSENGTKSSLERMHLSPAVEESNKCNGFAEKGLHTTVCKSYRSLAARLGYLREPERGREPSITMVETSNVRAEEVPRL